MPTDYERIWPYAIAVLAVLMVYRRLRRSFGRQPLRPVRMRVRIGLLLVLGCFLALQAMKSAQFLAVDFAGVLAGLALGIWGAQRTRFQTVDGQLHYIPHTYTGIAVSLLFIGRLAYRLLGSATNHQNSLNGPDSMQVFAPPAMMSSPLTAGLLFLVIGYYVCYTMLVLRKSKHISPEDLEAGPAPTAASP